MHADVVAMDVGGDFFSFARVQRKADALLQFRKKRVGGATMFEEEEFEASLFPALPQNFAGAKYFGDAANDWDDLFWFDKSIECDRQVRIGGKAATDAQCEANLGLSSATASGGSEADVVDFRIGAPVATAGDGNFKFAR